VKEAVAALGMEATGETIGTVTSRGVGVGDGVGVGVGVLVDVGDGVALGVARVYASMVLRL
jgi:hypothetical protein